MDLVKFIMESNAIENLHHQPTGLEVEAYERILAQDEIIISDLIEFVSVISDGKLRDQPGMDVIVGDYRPPPGGPQIREHLSTLLLPEVMADNDAWTLHITYERLHPFTDGNGRSGRLLWLWMMEETSLGFLQTFYYQTLATIKPK